MNKVFEILCKGERKVYQNLKRLIPEAGVYSNFDGMLHQIGGSRERTTIQLSLPLTGVPKILDVSTNLFTVVTVNGWDDGVVYIPKLEELSEVCFVYAYEDAGQTAYIPPYVCTEDYPEFQELWNDMLDNLKI